MKVSKSVIDRVGSWCALFGGRVAVAVLLACLVPAVSAQETQEQALARLDGILESLRDTRETTRTMNTLEAALEGSVSRFTCARLWGLGYVLGDAGAEAKFSGKAEVAFRVVTPFGVFQTYFADNGAPLHIGLTGLLGSSVTLDLNGGVQNWNCWSDDLWFDSPDPYDIVDYEHPYVYDLDATVVDTDDNQPDPGFVLAVEILNGLVDVIGEMGLDPSDAEVVERLLTGGGAMAIEAFDEISRPATLAERAARAPGQLISLLDQFVPGHPIADSVEYMLSMDWVNALNPCDVDLIIAVSDVCDFAVELGDRLADSIELIEQIPSQSTMQVFGISFAEYMDNYLFNWLDHMEGKLTELYSETQWLWTSFFNITSNANNVAYTLEGLGELASDAENLVNNSMSAFAGAEAVWDQFMGKMSQTYSRTYTKYAYAIGQQYKLTLVISYRPIDMVPYVSFNID